MQKGQGAILIIVGVLIVAAIAGGVYYLGKQVSPKPSSAPVVTSQTPQSAASPAPATDASREPTGSAETANWKTYTNTAERYSIKYPPNLIVNTDNDFKSDVTFYFPETINREFSDYISIGVRQVPKNITIQEAIEKGYSSVGSYEATKFKFENVTVDGVDALASGAPAALDAYDVHLIKNNKLFAFRVSAISVDKSTAQRKTFDQILSSFKFL